MRFLDLKVFSQNLPLSKERSIFKVDFNALKMQNLNICSYKYAYLPYLLWFVNWNRKETRPRRLWTIDLTFKKVGYGWKPLDVEQIWNLVECKENNLFGREYFFFSVVFLFLYKISSFIKLWRYPSYSKYPLTYTSPPLPSKGKLNNRKNEKFFVNMHSTHQKPLRWCNITWRPCSEALW